jgi:glycosyltransferase involved in cell wall biosynthesis
MYYLRPQNTAVIYNGRTPQAFDSEAAKESFALSVGRVWDEAKQVNLLCAKDQALPVRIVGWEQGPGKPGREEMGAAANVDFIGPKSQAELRELYSRAALYVATSRYEPFGLSPLEAALSRCALVMNDNPVFHELWGASPIYFKKNDPDDLARVLADLTANASALQSHAEHAYETARERFTAERMVREYERVYQEVCSTARVA